LDTDLLFFLFAAVRAVADMDQPKSMPAEFTYTQSYQLILTSSNILNDVKIRIQQRTALLEDVLKAK
jgi:hypothetical protein